MLYFNIDRNRRGNLFFQIYTQLRDSILNKKITSGEKLPSTRRLSMEYNISRTIFLEVYEQLILEGYLEGRHGSGTYVASGISDFSVMKNEMNIVKQEKQKKHAHFIDMLPGSPDLENFPVYLWGRYLRQAATGMKPGELGYNRTGDRQLKDELRNYLFGAKGIDCSTQQVFICAGSYQALFLASSILKDDRNTVVLEDPVYNAISELFYWKNMNVQPVPVDDKGMVVGKIPRSCNPSFYYVTPSHQYPTGSVMHIQRRMQLIERAREKKSYILENDYDSEFRFSGLPINSIYMLDNQHVIHVGTLTMSLYPGIRLAYLIVPSHLIEKTRTLKIQLGMDVPTVTQRAVAYFIRDGQFNKHLYKMKRLYLKKRNAVIDSLRKYFADDIIIRNNNTGLYLPIMIKGIQPNEQIKNKLNTAGILLDYSDEHLLKETAYINEMILGFGNMKMENIDRDIARLKQIITS